jgi:hypothetical protein
MKPLQAVSILNCRNNYSLKVPSNLFFPLVWLVIVTVLFLLPGSAIPKLNWLDKIWFDKWVHLGIFIITVLVWVYSLVPRSARPISQLGWLVALSALLYGIGIELIQHYFIKNRSFDTGDIIADAAGCAIGLVLSRRYIKK